MSSSYCYLIMAGGTGGHIFPAMAIAKALQANNADVHWLGTMEGMEQAIVTKENIPLHPITIKGFRGKKLFSKLLAPLLLLSAVFQSIKLIRAVNPNVVIGFGGYVSAPGGIAAWIMRKPLVIHEQNSVAGSTNTLLRKISSTVLEAFPGSLKSAVLVGNPVRREIKALFLQPKIEEKQGRKNLLITGGSLGAEAINTIIPKVLQDLPEALRPHVWHQTGKDKLQAVNAAYQQLNIEARTEAFISNVQEAYQWADIIICRAGALTVSEVSVAGLPAIFIPYPYAIDNHQTMNARWLVENEAAALIEQRDLTVQTLSALIQKMLIDEKKLNTMSKKLRELAIPDATEKVVAICEKECLRGIKNDI